MNTGTGTGTGTSASNRTSTGTSTTLVLVRARARVRALVLVLALMLVPMLVPTLALLPAAARRYHKTLPLPFASRCSLGAKMAAGGKALPGVTFCTLARARLQKTWFERRLLNHALAHNDRNCNTKQDNINDFNDFASPGQPSPAQPNMKFFILAMKIKQN